MSDLRGQHDDSSPFSVGRLKQYRPAAPKNIDIQDWGCAHICEPSRQAPNRTMTLAKRSPEPKKINVFHGHHFTRNGDDSPHRTLRKDGALKCFEGAQIGGPKGHIVGQDQTHREWKSLKNYELLSEILLDGLGLPGDLCGGCHCIDWRRSGSHLLIQLARLSARTAQPPFCRGFLRVRRMCLMPRSADSWLSTASNPRPLSVHTPKTKSVRSGASLNSTAVMAPFLP